MRIVYGLIFLLAISSCTSGSFSASSLYYDIPVGTKVIVQQNLNILPENGRVLIQNGKVITLSERDQYEYYCWFLSWKIKDTIQTIEAGTFTVTNVRHTEFYVELAPDRTLVLASSNEDFRLARGGVGATGIEYTTELTIHLEKQPDIRRFACSYWGDPGLGRHITLTEMRELLGDVVKITIVRPVEGSYGSR